VTICWPSNGQCVKCMLNVFNACPHSHMRRLDAKGWIKPKTKTQCWGESTVCDVKRMNRWPNNQP
jgi:hypothetical protein